jgi:hypothetical protein
LGSKADQRNFVSLRRRSAVRVFFESFIAHSPSLASR